MHDLMFSIATADVPLTPENVRPGWLAMLVVGILIVASVLLFRSFVKHTHRASEPWPGDDDHEDSASS
jgi:RsiW-degrading membrane proteinase PrsW (M82 family)